MMNKKILKAHPITIFYLMRSYWFVFATPIIRVTIQYVFWKKAQYLVPLEVVALICVICVAIVGWLFTKIVIDSDKLTIKKGVFLKRQENFCFKKVFVISARRNVIDVVFGCVSCCINTESEKNNKENYNIKLSVSDANQLCREVYGTSNELPVSRHKSLRRFLTIPLLLVGAITAFVLLKTAFFGSFNYYELMFAAFSLGLSFYYGGVCYYNYKCSRLCLGDKVFAIGSVGLLPKTFCCHKGKLGVIKITQTPTDRHFATCKIKIKVRGESGDSVKIKNIDIKSVVRYINREINANIKV